MTRHNRPFVARRKPQGSASNIRRLKGSLGPEEEFQALVNDAHNWQVPVFGEPFFTDPRTKKIVSGIDCPPDVLSALRP